MTDDNQVFQELKQEIARAVELLNEKHEGANVGEARNLLVKAKEAIGRDDYSQAIALAQKAQLAARPTTEYLLSKARSLENDGNQAYKEGDLAKAIELWQKSIEEYSRVEELATRRDEKDIVEAAASTTASIEGDIKSAFIEQANKTVDKAKERYDARDFDAAREEFEAARQLYVEGANIARKLGSEDVARLKEIDTDMAGNIEACLLGKGEILIEEASREKGDKRESAFSKVIKHLESFSSSSQNYQELKTKAYQGQATGRTETGMKLMGDAEKLLNRKEHYQAKEGYRKAQEYLESLRDFTVEHKLEKEKDKVDNLIEDCTTNIRLCTDSMIGRRERIAEGEIRRVKVSGKGTRPLTSPAGPGDEMLTKLSTEYVSIKRLGGGGFGDVFMVKNREGITVAIKVPRELNEDGEKIFFRELEIWRGLNHRNIVKLIRPRIRPVPLFEMEYIEGGDLSKLMENSEGLSPDRACRIAFDIARGLEYAHTSHNVIHTDLKPKNILFTGLEEAKISDWGLGKVATSSSDIQGYTLAYADPEQIDREKAAGEKTDVYQLGVIFYEMLTGRNPFASGDREEIKKRVRSLIPDKPSIYSGHPALEPLDDIVISCMQKDPKERPAIRQFREAVYTYMKGSYGESLHLTKQVGSRINLLCRNALLEAKANNYAELLPCLDELKNLVRNKQRKQTVQNLMDEMAFRKNQGMEIVDEMIDELNTLLRLIENG